jgi:predicted alpha/beta hydrolase family esterase
MNTPLHLIYVPGLGDHKVAGQQKLVDTWKWWGVSAELFQTGWADGEEWDPKFDRLLGRIDSATSAGKAVGLVGASAGATAVINAFHARQNSVVGVVLISGKINRPHAISPSLTRKNAAFGPAAHRAFIALSELSKVERSRIMSRYAMIDPIVPVVDSHVPGAHNRVQLSLGHAFTIATQMFFGAPLFIRFLRKQAKSINKLESHAV